MLAVLLGAALLFEHLGLVAYVGAMWWYFEVLVVGYEEPWLREQYGADYEDYCEDVPRWVTLSRSGTAHHSCPRVTVGVVWSTSASSWSNRTTGR